MGGRRRPHRGRGGLLAAAWLAVASAAGAVAAVAGSAGRPGPELRSGVVALQSGAFETAEQILADVERRYPLVADHAARLRVHALLGAGRIEDAAAAAAAFRLDHAGSPWTAEVAQLEGEARSRLGDEAGARRAFRAALAAARDREQRAALLVALAGSFERSGRPADARARYLEVWTDLAATRAAPEADAGLARLAGQRDARDMPSALAKRCRALAASHRNEETLEVCGRAIRRSRRGGAEWRALGRTRARALFYLRRYPDAAAAFAAVGSDRESRFWRARSLARSGRIDDAIAGFDALSKRPDSLGARARFLAGTLHEDDDAAAAREDFAWVAKHASTRSLRAEARWRLGWDDWRAGRTAEAAAAFAALAADEPDEIEALRGRYWAARARARLGDPRGPAELAELAGTYPLTYYGWRAARWGATPPPMLPAEPESPATLPPQPLERARILIEAQLGDEASQELTSLRPRLRNRADRLLVAQLLQDAGRFAEAQSLALGAYAAELSRGPRGRSPELWWVAWPDAFAPAVERAVAGRAVPPELVYAVMREESGFRPEVVSVVGARGLTQIMPATGARLAARLGADAFDPEELFDPARNLELGALYLEGLLQRFDGRLSAVIASYNAGPEAVERWLARDGQLEDDEWVEAIPYSQTHQYVKRVLRSVQAYRLLY